MSTGQECDRIVSAYGRRLESALRELLSQHDPAKRAHRTLATAQGDEARLRKIEERVDTLAGKLWGLTDKELAAIRRSLEKL